MKPKILILLTLAAATSLYAVEQVQLSTLDLKLAVQGHGHPGVDRSVEGKPLSIAGQRFEHGFGTHAPSELCIDLKGGSTRFTASVGIDGEDGAIGNDGSVEFIVLGDGKELFRSGVMRGGQKAKSADVDLTGLKMLILRVTDGGDGNARDHGDWAEAVFQVAGARPETVPPPPPPPLPDRWAMGKDPEISWNVLEDTHLPHQDFIEQSGRGISQVVTYGVSADRSLTVSRHVVWPTLRTIPNDTHASLKHEYSSKYEPVIHVDNALLAPMKVETITLDGTLAIRGRGILGIDVERTIFPTTEKLASLECWTLRNGGEKALTLTVDPMQYTDVARGVYGVYLLDVSHNAPASIILEPGKELKFDVTFSGRIANEAPVRLDAAAEEGKRRAFVRSLQQALRLETPDPVLDRTFAQAKIRVAESIFATRGGLMLGPGGLAYYAAVWCNDNVEYAGPFFPFLGDSGGNEASLNTYRLFRPFMGPDYHRIPSSIVAEGKDIWEGAGDRGDAAMYAYGASRFCLANGGRAVAEELWPAIAWCLEYCKRKTTADGVIASDSDELEGRFPAGKANLSTACLNYGGLRSAADLARVLGKSEEAREFDSRADALAKAIETFFGDKVEGFDTYRYYDGNDVLRSWICLPLCMGILDRKAGTIAALFSPRLWTPDGLATQGGDHTFWDRSTLYGLRGVFQAGETDKALRFLSAYSRRRLLGEHVPYAVEAWPEGGQRHLSSESGLYCRVFVEGLFGILPTGLDRFRCTPRLPEGWPHMALRSVRAFGHDFDLIVERAGAGVTVTVRMENKIVLERAVPANGSIDVVLPQNRE